MKNRFRKLTVALALATSAIIPCVYSATDTTQQLHVKNFPCIGSFVNSVTYGPVTLKNFKFNGVGPIIYTYPGDEITTSAEYEINADDHERDVERADFRS